MLYIYSHNHFSNGARELARELHIKRNRATRAIHPGSSDTVINWGSGQTSSPPLTQAGRVFNDPALVSRAGSKLAFFEDMRSSGSSVRVPLWTSDQSEARSWVDSRTILVARTVLRGHSGEGIVIIREGVDFVDAPLYTKYVKKDQEFRVHCAFDRLIDLQRKIKRPDFEGTPNWFVRNHLNGFIYVRNNVEAPQDVKDQAMEAFEASGLHFGAVDVIWNAHQGRAYVLEINTAPGLCGRTVQSYAGAFRSAFDDLPV